MNILVDGKTVKLGDKDDFSGGEAQVYLTPEGVVKIWKPPTHKDFDVPGQEGVGLREGATRRIEEHQRKTPMILNDYSTILGLDGRVIVPQYLATATKSNRILGYRMAAVNNNISMELLGRPDFRQGGSVSNNTIIQLFLDIDTTVRNIHSSGVVIGDCNDLNILTIIGDPPAAYFIDVDSWQFPGFQCRMFTPDFVDPLLCNPNLDTPDLVESHNPGSDVFAINTMLCRCLLLVDPYGGMYRPPAGQPRVSPKARKMGRISILHEGVGLASSVIHFGALPDDLLEHFLNVFERDIRAQFPRQIIESMRWTKCINCGTEHARSRCPSCDRISGLVKEVQRGIITITTQFRSSGTIFTSRNHGGLLRYLYNEGGAFRREDGTVVLSGDPKPQMRFRVGGHKTYIGMGNKLYEFLPGGERRSHSVDTVMGFPAFDANSRNVFWTNTNTLYRSNELGGAEVVGSVLSGRTLFWVGEDFGFGFYRAGEIQQGFVFDARQPGLRDVTGIPRISGTLIDSKAFFSRNRCWFLFAVRENGRTVNRCVVICNTGEVLATTSAESGDGSWLGTIRGKVVAKDGIFSVSDDGLVQVIEEGGAIMETSRYTDTEGLVQSDCDLQPGTNGTLHVIDRQRVMLLTIRGGDI